VGCILAPLRGWEWVSSHFSRKERARNGAPGGFGIPPLPPFPQSARKEWGTRFVVVAFLECGAGAQEAVEEDDQDDAGEDHVEAVVFFGETPDGEGYADYRGGDQQQQA
jgi:hypothetical protein